MGDHLCELCRRHAPGQSGQVLAGHVHIDQHPSDVGRGHGHGFLGDAWIQVVPRDELVDHVEVGGGNAIHFNEFARLDGHARRGVPRAREGGEAVLRILDRELVVP